MGKIPANIVFEDDRALGVSDDYEFHCDCVSPENKKTDSQENRSCWSSYTSVGSLGWD